MIEHLEGTHETVDYRQNTSIRLYDNVEYEDYPMHWHTCIEIIMPVAGGYELACSQESNVVHLEEGDVFLLCPGVLHHLMACEGERYILQVELAGAFSSRTAEAAMAMLYPAVHISPEDPDVDYPAIRQIMTDIVAEYSASGPMYEAAIYARVLELIVRMCRSRPLLQTPIGASAGKQKEYTEKFLNICSYINDHCTENLTLEMVAEKTGFSKYHFTRLFRQFTSQSFYKYLNQRRIEHAQQLLSTPGLSITDVALQSGFSSISSFIRMFRIVTGCTPSQFRSMQD